MCFEMDNTAAVHCIVRQGTSRSTALLEVSESIFDLANDAGLFLSAASIPGTENQWADALSRFKGSSVEWILNRELFQRLCSQWGTPQIDLFASHESAQLDTFLTRTHRTQAERPDALLTDWKRWQYVYLSPPPCTAILLKVVSKLRTFQGRVALVAPFWPSQPWFSELLVGVLFLSL